MEWDALKQLLTSQNPRDLFAAYLYISQDKNPSSKATSGCLIKSIVELFNVRLRMASQNEVLVLREDIDAISKWPDEMLEFVFPLVDRCVELRQFQAAANLLRKADLNFTNHEPDKNSERRVGEKSLSLVDRFFKANCFDVMLLTRGYRLYSSGSPEQHAVAEKAIVLANYCIAVGNIDIAKKLLRNAYVTFPLCSEKRLQIEQAVKDLREQKLTTHLANDNLDTMALKSILAHALSGPQMPTSAEVGLS